MTVRKLFLRQAQYTLQVVYEMAAVAALVESLGAAFREGFAAACVVAYESRAHKIEEVRKQNLCRDRNRRHDYTRAPASYRVRGLVSKVAVCFDAGGSVSRGGPRTI